MLYCLSVMHAFWVCPDVHYTTFLVSTKYVGCLCACVMCVLHVHVWSILCIQVDVVIIFVPSRYSCNVHSQSQELAQQYSKNDILTEDAHYIE